MPFGFIGLDSSKAAQYLVNGLAVGGGFLAGYLLTWFGANLLDRWATAGKTPRGVHKTARVLGGLLVAVLVALIVFGQGGDGLGFGGGPGDGKGQGTGDQKGSGASTQPTQPISADVKPTEPKTDAVPPEQRVRVEIFGGDDVTDERFYRIDDDKAMRTIDEVKSAIEKKKAAIGKPVGVEIRFSKKNTLPQEHPAVRRLTKWAGDYGFSYTFPAGQP